MEREHKEMSLAWVRQMVEILLHEGVPDDAEEMYLSVSYIKSEGNPVIQFRVIPSKEVVAEVLSPIPSQEVMRVANGWTPERKVSHSVRMRDYWQRRKESVSPILTA